MAAERDSQTQDKWARVPELAIAFAILLILASAVALAVALLSLHGDTRTAFLRGNEIGEATRRRILLGWLATCAVAAGGAAAAMARGRIDLETLGRAVRRLSPAIPLALAPALLSWRAWEKREVSFALAAVALGLLFKKTLAVAGEMPPLLSREPGLLGRWRRFAETRAGRALPFALVACGALGYAVYFSAFTILGHKNGLTAGYDLGIFDNLHWHIVNRGDFLVSSTGMGPDGGSHFGRHATFFAYAIAPIYALFPGPETLLAIQATLLGFAALPLYGFARHHLSPWGAALLSFAYLLYPPLHGSNLYDFHFLSLTPLFAFALAWAIERGKRPWIIAAVVLTLSVREDAAVIVAVLGVWQLLSRRVRLGLALVAAGAAYFGLMKFVLMPLSAGGATFSGMYRELVPPGGHGFGGVLETLLSNPAYAFKVATTTAKLRYALLIMAPLSFAPLRRPLGALFIFPGVLFTLLSSKPPVVSLGFQYTAFWTPYLFVAAALLLGANAFADPDEGDRRRRSRAWLGGLALASLLCSYQYGAVLQRHTAGGGFHRRYRFTTTAADLEMRRDRADIIARLPGDASVSASKFVVPHLSQRDSAYDFRFGPYDAEYILMSVRPPDRRERRTSKRALTSGEFGVVAENQRFVLLRRGAPTGDNERIFERIFERPMKPSERRRLVEPLVSPR